MTALANRIESRMERLSLPLALEWPGGRAEKAGAQVRLKLHKPSLLNWLALGRIGNLGMPTCAEIWTSRAAWVT
ncbi:hypothetical protein FQZ97_1000820 [compost metagenome]|jgi:cyclopropane-fatty-acyl-phospholipid synthase